MEPATEESIRAALRARLAENFPNGPPKEHFTRLDATRSDMVKFGFIGLLWSPNTPDGQLEWATVDCPVRDGFARVEDILFAWSADWEQEMQVRPLCDAWEALRP